MRRNSSPSTDSLRPHAKKLKLEGEEPRHSSHSDNGEIDEYEYQNSSTSTVNNNYYYSIETEADAGSETTGQVAIEIEDAEDDNMNEISVINKEHLKNSADEIQQQLLSQAFEEERMMNDQNTHINQIDEINKLMEKNQSEGDQTRTNANSTYLYQDNYSLLQIENEQPSTEIKELRTSSKMLEDQVENFNIITSENLQLKGENQSLRTQLARVIDAYKVREVESRAQLQNMNNAHKHEVDRLNMENEDLRLKVAQMDIEKTRLELMVKQVRMDQEFKKNQAREESLKQQQQQQQVSTQPMLYINNNNSTTNTTPAVHETQAVGSVAGLALVEGKYINTVVNFDPFDIDDDDDDDVNREKLHNSSQYNSPSLTTNNNNDNSVATATSQTQNMAYSNSSSNAKNRMPAYPTIYMNDSNSSTTRNQLRVSKKVPFSNAKCIHNVLAFKANNNEKVILFDTGNLIKMIRMQHQNKSIIEQTLRGHTKQVSSIIRIDCTANQYNSNSNTEGAMIASAGYDGKVILWQILDNTTQQQNNNPPSIELVYRCSGMKVHSMAYFELRGRKILVCGVGNYGLIQLLDIELKICIKSFDVGQHFNPITSLDAFQHEGIIHLLSGDAKNKLNLWCVNNIDIFDQNNDNLLIIPLIENESICSVCTYKCEISGNLIAVGKKSKGQDCSGSLMITRMTKDDNDAHNDIESYTFNSNEFNNVGVICAMKAFTNIIVDQNQRERSIIMLATVNTDGWIRLFDITNDANRTITHELHCELCTLRSIDILQKQGSNGVVFVIGSSDTVTDQASLVFVEPSSRNTS